jgi:hypothetical protein
MILPSSLVFLHRVAWLILECARRMSTFISCAFREQEDDQAAHPILPSLLVTSQGRGLIDLPLRASKERDARHTGRARRGGWSVWSILSISFVWLAGSEAPPEEPKRPDRPNRPNRLDCSSPSPARASKNLGADVSCGQLCGELFELRSA